MEKFSFSKLIEEFNLGNLEISLLSNNEKINSHVFKVKYMDSFYVLKLLKKISITQINLILEVLNKISDLNTPKLEFSEVIEDDGNKNLFNLILVFEYIDGVKCFDFDENLNFLKEFYKNTKRINLDEYLDLNFFFKFEEILKYLEQPLKSKVQEILDKLSRESNFRVILADINTSNSIKRNLDVKFYYFDFEEVLIGDIYWDLAYFYVDLYQENLLENSSFSEFEYKLKKHNFLELFNLENSLEKYCLQNDEKFNNYLILVLLYKSVQECQENKEIYLKNLEKLLI